MNGYSAPSSARSLIADDSDVDNTSESTGSYKARVPLLCKEVRRDDAEAAIVLIFPRSTEHEGEIDPEVLVEDSFAKVEELFLRDSNSQSLETLRAGWDTLKSYDLEGNLGRGNKVTKKVYHDVVCRKFLSMIQQSGLKASSFSSIDGDEVYLKIMMGDRQGELMKDLAQRYAYKMPLTEKCYKDMPVIGEFYPGKIVPVNSLGEKVPAYLAFHDDEGEHDDGMFEDFRETDEIRIIGMRFDRWVKIPELMEQRVITGYFAAADYDDAIYLHKNWASLRLIPCIPNDEEKLSLRIRDYFGEEVAFFFRWFTFYCRWLLYLAVPGAITSLLYNISKVLHEHVSIDVVRMAFVIFGASLTLWASAFTKAYHARAARTKQAWGMENYDTVALERPDYQAGLEGTYRLFFRKAFVNVVTCLFIGLFLIVLFLLESNKSKLTPLLVSGLLFVLFQIFSMSWSKVAPKLVDLQNHRTQARWDDALTLILSHVKIFIALFPFLNLAFMSKYFDATCGPDLASVFAIRYPTPFDLPGSHDGVALTFNNSWAWLDSEQYVYQNRDNETCIYGCYPVNCAPAPWPAGQYWCKTNCIEQAKFNLGTFYVMHVMFSVIFLIVPIILTKRAVEDEINRSVEADSDYSYLQFQAKCYQVAPYQYYSWGGSRVEDFLELAIGFALLTWFGIFLPSVAAFAFVSHLVEFRLVAFRMTNVTCRPMPRGAEGIGIWEDIFKSLCTGAVVCNVALATLVMQPISYKPRHFQFLAFIVMEHLMFLLQFCLGWIYPSPPEDVHLIGDLNAKVQQIAMPYPTLKGNEHLYDFTNVEIGLEPEEIKGEAKNTAIQNSWGPGRTH